MEKFLRDISQEKSIEDFILEKCSISEDMIETVANKFLNSPD